MKVEKEVRECDRCNTIFPIWWDSNKDDGPDYQVIYLGKRFDLCPNCYNELTTWLKNSRAIMR